MIIPLPWQRALTILIGLLFVVLIAIPGSAGAQETEQPSNEDVACAATGYLIGSRAELSGLRGELSEQSVHRVDGVPLRSGQTWVIPDGSQPVVVLDSTGQFSGGEAWVSLAGQEFEVASTSYDEPSQRYITNLTLPHLGSTVRSLGLRAESGPCEVAVALSVDRGVWSTVVGGSAIAVTAVFGLLTVLVARLRKGGWLRRFGFAAPLGLVAGLGQGAVVLEAGVVGPFDAPPWWAPVAGLGLAALLPLTRWPRRRPGGMAGEQATMPPEQAPLAGFEIEALVARTEVAGIYRATRSGPSAERALVKVALAQRYGEPAIRMRLEREASALSGLEHPNILRLRETVPDETGPPTLVFEYVDGAPLRQLLGSGSLSAPQALTVTLGVLDALQAVHARELVHRDVRPENVWLTLDGRVLLAGFELACAGVEHAVAPEQTAPYASPEQRAGRVLDGRSDLYACGVLLGELLTGQPSEALADVLARALAEDPADRPASAEQLATQLAEAAEQELGPDWVGRGGLAGAIVTYAAIGAAIGGYALSGGTGAAGGAGSAGGAAAGSGAAGLDAVSSAGLDAASSAMPGAASPASAAAGSVAPAASGAGAGAAGPVGAAANAGVAVGAAAALVIGAVLANPDPAEARSEVITPDQARVIFVRTVDEGQSEDFTHYSESVEASFASMLEEDESLADARLTDIVVGVAREQYDYPAWFVASAQVPFEDGTASLYARFEREAADEDWLMTTLDVDTARLLPAALLDDEGWLAPLPDVSHLLVDPESLPQRYVDWLLRAWESGAIGSDDVLTRRYDDDFGLLWTLAEDPVRISCSACDTPAELRESKAQAMTDYEISAGDVLIEPVPLADGTVQVRFTATASYATEYRPEYDHRTCNRGLTWSGEGQPSGHFRVATADLVVTADGWIPVTTEVPEPAASPEPTVTPSQSDPDEGDQADAELRLEPVDPDRVVLEDWRVDTENVGGERC